jgi:hypothetical protein
MNTGKSPYDMTHSTTLALVKKEKEKERLVP